MVWRKDLGKKSFVPPSLLSTTDRGSIVIEQGSIMDELESLSSSVPRSSSGRKGTWLLGHQSLDLGVGPRFSSTEEGKRHIRD